MRGPAAALRLHGSAMAARLRARGFVLLATVTAGTIAISFLESGRSHFVTGTILALTLGYGVVSGDYGRGTVLLWLQKPRSLVRFYLERLAEVVAAVWGAHTAMLALALVLAPHAPEPLRALAQLPAGLALDLATVAVVFGCSAVGAQPELIPALAVILVLGTLGQDAVVAPDVLGRWAPVLAAQRFPSREVFLFSAWLSGSGLPPGPEACVRMILYPAAWVGLGCLAVHARSHHPPLRGPDG